MPGAVPGEIIVDGSLDFSGGVDSLKVTTIQSQDNPNGLGRNELAWLTNASLRDGGITQRTGWQILASLNPGNVLFQGGFMYAPINANPYLILCFSGHTFKVDPDFASGMVDLSANPALRHPATAPHFFFVQGEQFLVIQAGDGVTLPLFWDGVTLRRSKGITNSSIAAGTPGVNEIPAATAMDYFMGRIWYAQDRTISAGDIVGGASGTIANKFKDAILNITENPLCVGGDGFTIPSNAGNIRSIYHNGNINTQLGQGQLYVGTRKAIYSLNVPITRTDWIGANTNNQPLITVAQLDNGTVNDRSIVKVNGDIFHQSLEPGIRSMFSSVRYFGQWGNRQISANEQRVLDFVDRSLLIGSTGIFFDNRVLMSTLPVQKTQGIVHQGLIPMDVIPISDFSVDSKPNWEGMYEGLDHFQLFTGDFGGRERGFSVVLGREQGDIQLWELTDFQRDDINEHGEARVTWIIEFPAFTWKKEWLLKKLVSAELWVDKVFGKVDFLMEFRPDGDPCWLTWHKWSICSARNSCEDVNNPICYPLTTFRETYKQTMTLPIPPEKCETISGRPSNVCYQCQPRLTIKGWCRLRGLLMKAMVVERKTYENMVC